MELARLLQHQGQNPEARSLLEEAVVGFMDGCGPAHEETLRAKMYLALLLWDQGQSAEARPFLEEAVAGFEESKGPAHRYTRWAKKELVDLLRELGQSVNVEALHLNEEIEQRSALLPQPPPSTCVVS